MTLDNLLLLFDWYSKNMLLCYLTNTLRICLLKDYLYLDRMILKMSLYKDTILCLYYNKNHIFDLALWDLKAEICYYNSYTLCKLLTNYKHN